MNNLPMERVDNNTGEIIEVVTDEVIRETEDYAIVRLPSGKFEKRIKYKAISTYEPETEEEQIQLYNIFNQENNPDVKEMKTLIDEEIIVKDFITKPYESFSEETGNIDFGVVTTLITDDGRFITTSSKLVYFNIIQMVEVFELPLRIRIEGIKRERGTQIGLTLLGRA